MGSLPKSCVIGAGASGITACKALKERGLPFDCFESSGDVGGVWHFGNPHSSAYRRLHINTSKARMQFSDFPMDPAWPDFCHYSFVHEYFRRYVAHFGLGEAITFNTAVEHAARGGDGVWRVRLSTGEAREYDALFVCNGHHWDPQWPDPPFPGHFDGRIMHSHHFRGDDDFRGKKVVILGIGNSALDIAVELSYSADAVYLAMRRGAYIIPKYIFGRPLDHWVVTWLPYTATRGLMRLLLRMQVGPIAYYGIPAPDHRLLEAHPSISSNALDRLAHGGIVAKPNIAALEGGRVRFADGSAVEADVIVYSTGYKVSFPFFDTEFIAAPDNDLPLYLRMFKPDIDNVFFIGLFQPLGAIFPISEMQAVIAGDYLLGRYHLPRPDEMRLQMASERAAMFKRYVKSKRHTMQVDFDPFMRQLRRELQRGSRRAAAAGNRLPVPPRAGRPAAPAHAAP